MAAPTIAVQLTQRELDKLIFDLGWQFKGTLADKLQKARVDIRPIVREAKRKEKEVKALRKRQREYDNRVSNFFEEIKEES